MSQKVITSGPISEEDLAPNTVIECDGKWFCIHFLRDGQVYFARGSKGQEYGDSALRMPPSEFIHGINERYVARKD